MKRIHYLFVWILVSFSCSNDYVVDVEKKSDIDTNFVSSREAIALASMLQFDVKGNDGTRSTAYFDVESATPYGSEETPSYYIINYENNSGFIIISADKRVNPVLAFSTEGSFDINNEELPEGLSDWMKSSDEYVRDIREYTSRSSELRLPDWVELPPLLPEDPCIIERSTNALAKNICNPNLCEDEFEEVDYFLTTVWNQWEGYNDLIPLNCGTGKAPVGCVAVAMAQVMKYYRYPNTYNWSAMPNMYGTQETARLMRDIGAAVGMKYGCDASGTTMKNAASALVNRFNYSSAVYKEYSSGESELIVQQLKRKQPVMFAGSGSAGHAWVCDGYRRYRTCVDGGVKLSYLYFHMNWGWDNPLSSGKKFNGWFSFNNWSVGGKDYNKNKAIIYNIKP